MTHFQLKYQCLYCNTAFIVLVEDIKPYHADGAHCPDCRATGTSLRHDSIADGCIEDVVPGDSPLSHVGEHIEEQHVDGELHAYVLKEDVRRQIGKDALLDGLASLLPSADRKLLLEAIGPEERNAALNDSDQIDV